MTEDRSARYPLVVEMDGQLTWSGYVMRCPKCGSDREWSLVIEQPQDATGELAWAMCPADHRFWHPLVYPDIVRGLAKRMEAESDLERHRRGTEDLGEWRPTISTVPWTPHWEDWSTEEDGRRPVYRSWLVSGPVRWYEDWAELVSAHKAALHLEIAEWARTTETDSSAEWMLRWGTTDPEIDRMPPQDSPAGAR